MKNVRKETEEGGNKSGHLFQLNVEKLEREETGRRGVKKEVKREAKVTENAESTREGRIGEEG